MMNGFVSRILIYALVIFAIFGLTSPLYAAKPQTIPALQQWTDGTGSFTFGSTNRIVLNQTDAATLTTTAQVFQSDIAALKGSTLPIVNGSLSTLQAGDIFLSLGATNSTLGTEGYNMVITDRIIISAPADAGAFYATRTILQLLKQSNTIAGGTAVDYPRYPVRALHVDNGRLFVTVDWLENHIKELAFLKMNIFHWHLAEWNNFRFQSDTHPEIVAKQYYTKAQVAQMMALAAQYHVTIIPEFEMPGHMNWLLDVHPELGVVDNQGNVNSDDLDLTNPASYTFVSDLLNEWLPLIPGPYFHMGSDEYITNYAPYPQYTTYAQENFGPNANAQDVYLHFLNWVDGIVKSYGKKTWAWDDNKTGGSAFTLNKDFMLDSWTFAAQTELSEGFFLTNSAQASLYYVWYTDWQPMQTELYQQWAPNQWSYGNAGPIAPYASGLLGAKMELWFDNNQCEEYSMAWGMHYALRTMAQQTWASSQIFTQYTDFQTFSDNLGHAPGTTFPTTLPPIVNPNGPYTAELGSSIAFSSAGTSARNGTLAKYSWNFGDGGTSTQANPTYTYTKAGNFTAELIVTDSNGMTAGNQAIVSIVTGVAVNISPSTAKLLPNGTQAFTATVTGSSNAGVTWAATGGTVSSAGLYTAPAGTGSYTVTATSVVDNTKSASAAITVATAPPPGSNLALNQPTTASSSYSTAYAPSMATDNDPNNTRWCASGGNNGEWLVVDLGAAYTLNGTQVKWESNGVWQYKVEVSTDNVNWKLVVDRTANTAAAQIYNDAFSSSGRYVRITATTNQPGHWASIYDFEVFGNSTVPPPPPPPPPPTSVDLALNQPTTASSIYSSAYSAAMATDNDPVNTRWCASNGTNGQWLIVDLGAVHNLTGTSVKWESNGVWQYKIEVSNDHSTWLLAIDQTANSTAAQTYNDTFTSSGRYVRITATTNQPGHWASVYDFEVYGS